MAPSTEQVLGGAQRRRKAKAAGLQLAGPGPHPQWPLRPLRTRAPPACSPFLVTVGSPRVLVHPDSISKHTASFQLKASVHADPLGTPPPPTSLTSRYVSTRRLSAQPSS